VSKSTNPCILLPITIGISHSFKQIFSTLRVSKWCRRGVGGVENLGILDTFWTQCDIYVTLLGL